MILREAGGPVPTLPASLFAEHLRLAHGFSDDGSEDALLERCLSAAAAWIERQIGQALIVRSFELETSCWTREGHLVMPTGPVVALVSAELAAGGAVRALDVTGWSVEAGTCRQRLSAGGSALPEIPPGGRVRLVFTAGHAPDWGGLVPDLRQAVLLLAADFYARRGNEVPDDRVVPASVPPLLAPWRPVRL